MGCESIEVPIEAITGEQRQASRSQELSQGMDDAMCHVLRAGTQMEHRKNLGARVDGQPEPEHLFGAAQPRAQFVLLKVREPDMAEAVLVQNLRVLASPSQPGGDSRLPVAEDPLRGGWVQPFCQRRGYPCDLLRRGFQQVQRGVAPSCEGGVAGLTTKRLDPLNMTMLPIPDESMDGSICDPEVRALLIGTGKAFGGYPLGCSSSAFHLTPGTYWCTGRSHTGGGSGGETTGGAVKWGAWRCRRRCTGVRLLSAGEWKG